MIPASAAATTAPPAAEPSIHPAPPTRPARIVAFDLARGAAVVFMILIHVLNLISTEALEHHTRFGRVVSLLGSTPAAPVFMLLMGASFVLAPPRSTRAGIGRGLQLLATGYALNLARFVAPLALARSLDPTAAIPHAQNGLLAYAFIIDILQFAGLAYIVLTLLHARRARSWAVGALLVEVALVSPYLWGRFADVPVVGRLADLLWGSRGELVAFPLFPWLAYPLAGYLLGQWLQRAPGAGIDHFFSRLLRVALPLLVAGGLWTATDPTYHLGDYWHTGPGGIAASIGFIGVWLWGWHHLSRWVRGTSVEALLLFGSRNVTTIYLIQWTLIGWLTLLTGYKTAGLTATLLWMVLALVVSLGLAWGRNRWWPARRSAQIARRSTNVV